MRISKITMHNFRIYKDSTICFKKNGAYDLHYILVENGIGKTTLLNAIDWCLYGDEPHLGLKSQALPIINMLTLKDMKVGEVELVTVKLEVETIDGVIEFCRTDRIRKTEEEDIYKQGSNFNATTCYIGQSAYTLEGEEAINLVKKFVPHRIRKFFFFDGEQMDTYFTTETGINVENSIFEISQIDILNKMSSNLSVIVDEKRREAAKLNPKSEEINEKYEAQKKLVNQLTATEVRLKNDVDISKIEYKKCSDALGEEPDIAVLEINREELNKELAALDKQREEQKNYMCDFIRRYTVLLYAFPRLQKTAELIHVMEVKKQLPPQLDVKLLKKMLNDCTCLVCDRNLDENSTKHVKELVSQYELSNGTAAILHEIKGNIESLIVETKKYPLEKKKNIDSMRIIDNTIQKAQEDKGKIDSVLDAYSDKEHIKFLHDERKKYEELLNNSTRELIIVQENLKMANKKFKDIEILLDKELDKQNSHIALLQEKNMTEKATKIINNIISEIKSDVRDKISAEMSTKFFKLIWKRDSFGELNLSDSYKISLKNIDGYECLGSCSAAERELLVLAFTLALHKESGFDGPLVIDTPLSRISGILRRNISNVLKEISKEKQIILYLTEDEYSIQVRDVFEPYASSKKSITLVDEKYVKMEDL